MFSEKNDEASLADIKDGTLTSRPPGVERDDILVIATLGEIHAVHKEDGSHLWHRLYPTGAGGGVVSLFITDQDKIIAGATGKTASIDLFTGRTLWVNQMKKCGYEEVGAIVTPSQIVSLPTDSDQPPPAYAATTCPEKQETQEAVKEEEPQVVIACTGGKCMGIDLETGEDLWTFHCPKGGFKLSTAVMDPPGRMYQAGQGKNDGRAKVYLGCGTMLYCLDARSGEVGWSTQITKSWKGFDYLTMATAWSSRCAAVAMPGYNQFPSAHQEHAIRTRRNGFPGAVVRCSGQSSADVP
ncbi:hypothetical protein BX666DRAFT_2125103 [Dichotomocladium elegans]|nr:hypothetical protein BX666DRAFT_2125103 [Dichotomocladium elegans]